MFSIPNYILAQIKEAMKRSEGTVTFESEIDGLFNKQIPSGIIFKVITDEYLFFLERDNYFNVNLYHFILGKGTRVATINLDNIKQAKRIFWGVYWSSKELKLSIGSISQGSELITSNGISSNKIFRIVGEEIIQIGDEEEDIIETNILSYGEYVLESTAIEAWNNTIKAVEILQSGISDNKFIHEVVQSNLSITTLVTGFEIYTKRRCIELYNYGIKYDLDALVNAVFTSYERENNEPEILRNKVKTMNISLFEEIIKNKISFLSYDECKRVYAKAYKIRFNELGLSPKELINLQKIIHFRHRIIHISPLLNILNQSETPLEEPIISKKDFAISAIILFDKFIQLLHKATLNLNQFK